MDEILSMRVTMLEEWSGEQIRVSSQSIQILRELFPYFFIGL